MAFEELNQNQRIQDPEVRRPGEIKHGDNSVLNIKKKSTSVSVENYQRTRKIVGLVFFIIFIAVIAYGAYYGVSLYAKS